jgi:hypothetical protein
MERLTAFDEEKEIQQLPLHRFWRGLNFGPQRLRNIAHHGHRITNSNKEQPATLTLRFHSSRAGDRGPGILSENPPTKTGHPSASFS